MYIFRKPDRRSPTGYVKAFCPQCNRATVAATLQTSTELYYRCVDCGHVWSHQNAEDASLS